MNPTNVEILVIGGGVIGSSIAYHLARQGRQVLVVERSEVAVSPAACWASAGGVRRQGRHPDEAMLAIEAIERWRILEQELQADLHYRQGGNLLLAESDTEANQLSEFVHRQQEVGFVDVRLVDRNEALALVPGLNERVVAGRYSPSDGQADPVLTTRAFASAAQRFGAIYRPPPLSSPWMNPRGMIAAFLFGGEWARHFPFFSSHQHPLSSSLPLFPHVTLSG